MKQLRVLALFLFLPMASFPPSPAHGQASNAWLELLKSPEANTRAKAARELGKSMDTTAIPALVAAVKDPSAKVRREVVIALSQMRQPESLDAAITATRDSDDDVRVVAVQGLVGYYSGQLPTPGFTGLVKKSWRRVKGRLVADSTRIDPGVTVDPKVISALEETLKDPHSIRASREAAKGLGILVAQPAVPSLVEAAHSSDPDLALEALDALSKIKDQSAGPRLIDLLDSSHKEVKREAAVTVGILRARDALPKLQTMVENDPDRETREKALEGLAYLGDPVSIPLFIKRLWNADKAMRTFAAEGLARAGDTKTLSELENAVVAEKDADARLAMQFAVTALGRDDYLSVVVKELGSTLRGDITRAYLVELSRDSAFLPKLYPHLNSQDAGVRKRLCAVLMFTGDRTSLGPLERLTHDPNGEVATEALRALRAIRVRVSSAGPAPATGRASL